MTARQIVVVDVETNGLDLARHQAVEVAWWNLTTDERDCFVPSHDISAVLAAADVRALQVNRYIDRIPGSEHRQLWPLIEDLVVQLMGSGWEGATLCGSNPAFDAAMLTKLITRVNVEAAGHLPELDVAPWHHRLWDLSAYAAGVLGLDELPGLARVCELLDIPAPDHTAEGDVTATGLCFQALMAKARVDPAQSKELH